MRGTTILFAKLRNERSISAGCYGTMIGMQTSTPLFTESEE